MRSRRCVKSAHAQHILFFVVVVVQRTVRWCTYTSPVSLARSRSYSPSLVTGAHVCCVSVRVLLTYVYSYIDGARVQSHQRRTRARSRTNVVIFGVVSAAPYENENL